MKTIVCLVSKETIPNILFIREHAKDRDKCLLISTSQMEKEEKTKAIINSVNLPSIEYIIMTVEEDNITDIQSKLKTEHFEEEIHVNLTCGTKIMLIAVYDFFKSRNARMYYMPIGQNTEKLIYPELGESTKIKTFLSLKDYLTGYSVNVDRIGTLFPERLTDKLFEVYQRDDEKFKELCRVLRNYRDTKLLTDRQIDLSYLQGNIPELLTNSCLTKEAIQFITGGWFEEYVAHKLINRFSLPSESIGVSVKIQKEDKVDNECDILFVKDNALNYVECKTSISYQNEKGKTENIMTEAIYQFASVRKDFGLNINSYFVTLAIKGTEKYNVRLNDLNRAKSDNITLITGEDFADNSWLETIK